MKNPTRPAPTQNEQIAATNVEQTMTSLRISELSGVPHNDVMKKLRKLEFDWTEVGQGNFSLIFYTDSMNRKKPMYVLDYDQSMYIISAFDNKIRAQIILEWSALKKKQETEELPSKEIRIDRTMRRYATPMRYPMPRYSEVRSKVNPAQQIGNDIMLLIQVMEYTNPVQAIITQDDRLFLEIKATTKAFGEYYHKPEDFHRLLLNIDPSEQYHMKYPDGRTSKTYIHVDWYDRTYGAIYRMEQSVKIAYSFTSEQMNDILMSLIGGKKTQVAELLKQGASHE